MRIGEVAEKTGLSVSNIRFYERKGLLTPEREAESKYRDYSEKDVKRLKQIVLYRKMNLPIETIYLLLSGEASLESVLKRQEKELTDQWDMLQGAIDLCRKMQEVTDAEQLDVDYYLNYVKEEEEKGKIFGEVEELLEDVAEFSHLTKFRGDPYVGKYLLNVWVIRGIAFVCAAIYVIVPLWEIAHGLYGSEGMQIRRVIFWMIWLLGLIWMFCRFRKRKG